MLKLNFEIALLSMTTYSSITDMDILYIMEISIMPVDGIFIPDVLIVVRVVILSSPFGYGKFLSSETESIID